MKRFTFVVCFVLLLLLIAAAPVTAVGEDAFSSISPAAGMTGKTVSVTITGNNFTNTQGSVRLEKSGDTDISATITSWSTTQIVCSFKIATSKDTGDWDVVVTKGYDNTEIQKDNAFTITGPIKLTSISPKTARAGTRDVDFTIIGTNLDEVEEVFLYNDLYDDNITADSVDPVSSTKVTGTFDLKNVETFDTFDVCLQDANGAVECDLSFEITTNEVGSIDISSEPSGATILIDGIANGTTPNTVDNLVVGSYKVVLRKSGYSDWGKVVNVKVDDTASIEATLYAAATATTTAPTAVQTTSVRSTTTTVKKSTLKMPTPIPTATTTEASPVEPVLVIGTVCLALLALRKY